ncbi:MAG: hypothetical protein LBF39_01950 [Prevotellaceae bacterium]|jgi:hypothetical protein|nr:hypothetical protein [Prevotellaceae bacterium]
MKTTMTKQFLFLALLGGMVMPMAAQTVDVTLQCGQSYTINSTVPATAAAGLTYRWLENGSTVTGTAANYTVPVTKSVGIYTYIRQAMSEGCTDWQNSNAFTVEVKNKDDDGVCINGLTWAKYNVDDPGNFTQSIYAPGKYYQTNRNTPIDPNDPEVVIGPYTPDSDWMSGPGVCPLTWRVATLIDWQKLHFSTPVCAGDTVGLIVRTPGAAPTLRVGPDACNLVDPKAYIVLESHVNLTQPGTRATYPSYSLADYHAGSSTLGSWDPNRCPNGPGGHCQTMTWHDYRAHPVRCVKD